MALIRVIDKESRKTRIPLLNCSNAFKGGHPPFINDCFELSPQEVLHKIVSHNNLRIFKKNIFGTDLSRQTNHLWISHLRIVILKIHICWSISSLSIHFDEAAAWPGTVSPKWVYALPSMIPFPQIDLGPIFVVFGIVWASHSLSYQPPELFVSIFAILLVTTATVEVSAKYGLEARTN